MPYADTDFFLAILKKEDWLKSSAKFLYERYKGKIWTSSATIIEILIISNRYGLDVENVVDGLYGISEIINLDKNIAMQVVYYIKRHNMNVFDAFHAAFCWNEKDKIISSDKKFDEIGLERIELK